jgi:hypothetical protein
LGAPGWPLNQGSTKEFWLDQGRLSPTPGPQRHHEIRSPLTCGLGGGEWCPRDAGGTGPEYQFDQREDDGRSLCFETEPLTERLEIIGAPTLSITLSADQPVAMLAVRLSDVASDGTSSRITFGLFNLCHRDGHAEPKAIVPGDSMSLTLPLKLVAYAFLPGHRIRLALSNTYWPMAWPSPRDTTLSLAAGETSLALPLSHSGQVTELGEPFEAAECSPPLPTTMLDDEKIQRTINHDVGRGTVTIVHQEDSGPVSFDGIGLVVQRTMSESFRITEGESTSANTHMTRTAEMRRGDWCAKTENTLEVTCDEANFTVSAQLDAFENGERIFSRSWDDTIPRDHV